jgi:hypothetical protein
MLSVSVKHIALKHPTSAAPKGADTAKFIHTFVMTSYAKCKLQCYDYATVPYELCDVAGCRRGCDVSVSRAVTRTCHVIRARDLCLHTYSTSWCSGAAQMVPVGMRRIK